MKELSIKVNNLSGLTSRSEAELVEEANHYKCDIEMVIPNGEKCDLKSIMNVFALSPVVQGDIIKITFSGVDEEQALIGFNKLTQLYQF